MPQLNFLFGLGIFLFGMNQLEMGIRMLGDSRLRLAIRASTGSRFASVSTGIVSTAILQSSSMVSLLVLAFASAGLIPLLNAIGIILGANLGTTLTGWLVAIFGFKLDLQALALPLLGSAAFILALCKRDSRLHHTGLMMLGIGLLLFGLGIMKTSMEALPERWDVSILQGHHPVLYLLFGVVIAALVQSSSAVMMMALAALNAEFIALPEAVALIIGADLGTTSTTMLGSLTGSTIKRQLAAAHFCFNFIVDIGAFLLLLPLLPTLQALVQLQDPLYALVAFHSLMNLLGLAAFLPFLQRFADWIERLFDRDALKPANVLDRVSPEIVDAALIALRDTVQQLILQAACNSLWLFGLKPEKLKIIDANRQQILGSVTHQRFAAGYEELKQQEGRILNYSRRIQAQPLEPGQAATLDYLQLITRHSVFSNKDLKDIQHDLSDLKHGAGAQAQELYEEHKRYQKQIYEKLIDLLLGDHTTDYVLEELTDIRQANETHSERSDALVQSGIGKDIGEEEGISKQFNTNREIRHAVKTLTKAIEIWARLRPASQTSTSAEEVLANA